MSDALVQPTPTPAVSPAVEQLRINQQLAFAQGVHIQFVTALTLTPSVQSWPADSRKLIYDNLQRTAKLFGPRNPEEEALYGAE